MIKFALALVLGMLLGAGPMCSAFAGDDDKDGNDQIVKMIQKLLSGSKGDRAKLVAEIEKLVQEFRAGRDDDDDDDKGAADHDEAAEHASRGGFLGIQADKGEHCVKVVRVLPGTAAAKAGLRANDEVTEVNGQKIDEVKDLVARISSFKPGSEVTLSVLRGEKIRHLKATLGDRSSAEADDDDDDEGAVDHDEKSEHEGRGVRGHDEKKEHENGGKDDDDDDDR